MCTCRARQADMSTHTGPDERHVSAAPHGRIQPTRLTSSDLETKLDVSGHQRELINFLPFFFSLLVDDFLFPAGESTGTRQ